jgi:hypothetical protein
MHIVRFGGWLLGGICLSCGLAVLLSGIDPADLCFKRCEIPNLIIHMLGPSVMRTLIGLFFIGLGLAFLAGLLRSRGHE